MMTSKRNAYQVKKKVLLIDAMLGPLGNIMLLDQYQEFEREWEYSWLDETGD